MTFAITVNGESREIAIDSAAIPTVIAVLQHLALPTDRVAVELNKALVRKRDWETTAVASGARFEIVEFVGGG